MKRLLIVDDEAELAETLASILKSKTLEPYVCINAIDALSAIKTQKFDCIVSDLSMPNMNGVEFLKEIRRLGLDTPFIIYTAFGSDENSLEAAKYGCFDFIEKPGSNGLKESVVRAVSNEDQGNMAFSETEINDMLDLLKKEDKE